MAVYAIGDIQGCRQDLERLLDQLSFDPALDRLWFAGDLVNRGPDSLGTLRLVSELGDAALCVLGNHDLHLLALAHGVVRGKHEPDLEAILRAADGVDLVDWLRHRPLLHHDPELDFTLVHAGLPPQWDLATAQGCAQELEQVLRGPQLPDFLSHMYGNEPNLWDPGLSGIERWRFITNSLTRLRYCDSEGRLDLKSKGPPGTQASGCLPWFRHPQRRSREQRILFGHWSTLGYRAEHNVWALDSGCIWGGQLTALRIDGERPTVHQRPCQRWLHPRKAS
jgi:bis(5'-nucleosyl)-tetraphosphatase (symmetrical)